MKKDCLEIGTIQAFLDGELASDLLETAATHLALCDDCAALLAAAEEESAIVFSALDAELNTLVPTQRLWTKINNEIEKERRPFWQTVFAFFKNPAVSAFASLMIVFGVFMGYLNLKNGQSSVDVARTKREIEQVSSPAFKTDEIIPEKTEKPKVNNEITEFTKTDEKLRNHFTATKTVIKETVTKIEEKPKKEEKVQPAAQNYLPGEASYIRTIGTLENNVNRTKDETLSPSARFTFEQNLAMVNDVIKKMREQLRKNPRNEAARQLLAAAYQNKIDLLNSVAEKEQLMASMR